MKASEDKKNPKSADSKQNTSASAPAGRRQGGDGFAPRKNRHGGKKNAPASEYQTETVCVRRVSQASKGGRSFSFSVLVVSGDGKGKIGFGLGSSNEVPTAIQQATARSQQDMLMVPMSNGTIHQTIRSSHGASDVLMMPAKSGTGIIAGNAMRSVFKVLGIENIVAKSLGSSNPINVVRATFAGLRMMKTARSVSQKRGVSIAEVLGVSDEDT